MSNFEAIKARVRKDLNDRGVTYFSNEAFDDSFKDGYEDIIALSKGIIKKTTVAFITSPYYDFKKLGVTDFMAVVSIFNTNTNRWILDDKTLRDFDLIKDNWELWTGTPMWGAPVNSQYYALVPHYASVPLYTMDLYYWAVAPEIVANEAPLIQPDMQDLLDFYCMADLLEQAEEFVKAAFYWKLYFEHIEDYSERISNLAKRDLLRLM